MVSKPESYYKEKLIPPETLSERIAQIKESGCTVVTVNGSFDLMHAGHLYILHEAALQGDLLLVALNTDSSIRRYKHPDRPIIALEYRIQLMAALECVDYVTWFDETDPIQLLTIIQPDIHVNGVEYGENCIEADLIKRQGGKLHLAKRIPGLATSTIIKKIVSLRE